MAHQVPAITTFAFVFLWVALFGVLGTRPDVPREPVTWETILNLSYPHEYAENGLARMQDGVYAYQAPDDEEAIDVRVASVRTYLDVRGRGEPDAFPLLMTNGVGTGNVFDLAMVGRVDGRTRVIDHVRVGEHVELRSVVPEEESVHVRLRVFEPEDEACCPSKEIVRSYGLVEGQLTMVQEEEVPFTPPSQDQHVFDPESMDVSPGRAFVFSGNTQENQIIDYVLPVTEGQGVSLRLEGQDVGLSVYGVESGKVFARLSEDSQFNNRVEASEDLAIRVVPLGWGERPYVLTLNVTNPPTPTPEPTATPVPVVPGEVVSSDETPGGGSPSAPPAPQLTDGVIYLTFDDGPTPTTYQVLDLLDQYNAKATFFALGAQVLAHPDAVARAAASGHRIANHTYIHDSLVGMSREVFMDDIGTTQAIIEQHAGAAATRCLRPPYGATDAVSQAYAAEMGFHTTMWSIDTLDWTMPGTDAIIASIMGNVTGAGDVILLHDGYGDRSQMLNALHYVIPTLQAQGLRFEALAC